jgi:hypothetical protein
MNPSFLSMAGLDPAIQGNKLDVEFAALDGRRICFSGA